MQVDFLEPKHKRKLSFFLCREMLYDYVCGQLDPRRQQAIEAHLADDEQSVDELQVLRDGIAYCEKLAQATPHPQLLQALRESQPWPRRLVARLDWRRWPAPLSLGLEALSVSAVVAIFMSAIPWDHLRQATSSLTGSVELAQVPSKNKKNLVGEGEEPSLVAQSEPQAQPSAVQVGAAPPAPLGAPDDAVPASASVPAASPLAPAASPLAPAAGPFPPPSALLAKPAPQPIQIAKGDASVPLPKGKTTPPSAVIGPEAVEENPDTTTLPENARAYRFKLFMRLSQLDEVTPKITEALKSLGAVRAGEVDLGWRRPTGSYFHFTLPSESYRSTIQKLQSFGPVRIFREPQQRLMPEGKIRFILWVEDNK